jgi:hypothetical protein
MNQEVLYVTLGTVQLMRAETLLARIEQVDGHPPLGQRNLWPLEYGADRNCELAFAFVAVVEAGTVPVAWYQGDAIANGAAMRANRTTGPANRFKGLAGVVLVNEDRVLELGGYVGHSLASKWQSKIEAAEMTPEKIFFSRSFPDKARAQIAFHSQSNNGGIGSSCRSAVGSSKGSDARGSPHQAAPLFWLSDPLFPQVHASDQKRDGERDWRSRVLPIRSALSRSWPVSYDRDPSEAALLSSI